MTDDDRARSIRDTRTRGLGVVLGWHVLLVAGYFTWASLQPTRHSPDSCDGLGFGCTPNPHDGALIVGIVYGGPVVVGMLIVAAILTAVLAFKLQPAWKAGTAATLATWLIAGCALLSWLR